MYFIKLKNCTKNKNTLTPPDWSKNHCLGFNSYKLLNALKDIRFLKIKSKWIMNKVKGTKAKFKVESIFPIIPSVLEIIPQ
jgi:hypothetical protein